MGPSPGRMFFGRPVRVIEADRLHGPVSQRVHAARCHYLDRHAAFEIWRVGFPFAELGLLTVEQALMKGQVLLLRHRAVDVVLTPLVPAGGHPADVHVYAVAVNDWRDGVEKGEAIFAGRRHYTLRKSLRGQRAGCHDGGAGRGEGIDPLAHDLKIGQCAQFALDLFGKDIAIDSHSAARGNPRFLACSHDEAVQPPHFMMKQSDGVVFVVVGAKAVRTDQFGQAVRLVGGRRIAGPAHLRQPNLEAPARKLPSRFAPGQTAAYDMDIVLHAGLPVPLAMPVHQALAMRDAAPRPHRSPSLAPRQFGRRDQLFLLSR